MKRMKTSRTLILTISALMMLATLASCVDDDPVKKEAKGHTLTVTFSTTAEDIPETKAIVQRASAGSEADKAGFSYELVSSDADSISTSSPMTKAPTTLKNAYALLFKSDGNFNGRANIGTITAGTDKEITFTDVVTPTASNCRLVVVANDNAATNSYASTFGTGNFASFSGTYAVFQSQVMTNAISSDADIPYTGSVTVNLSSGSFDGVVSVPLYRTLAKITFTNTFNITNGPARSSITLYNTGAKRFAQLGSNSYDGTGSTQTSSWVSTTTGNNANTNTWYAGENIQPAVSNITTAADRNKSKAPDRASYIRIQSAASSANIVDGNFTWIKPSFAYDIYLGKSSDVTDFTLRRHTNYTITSTVSGAIDVQASLAKNDGRVTMIYDVTGIGINYRATDNYKAAQSNLTDYPPFNYDGGKSADTYGYDYGGTSTTPAVITPYTIEVEKTERGSATINYISTINYCKSLGGDWRIPTIIELKTIYDNKTALQNTGCATFSNSWYWSSSVSSGYADRRSQVNFSTGTIARDHTGYNNAYIRCVREIIQPTPPAIITVDQTAADAYKTKQPNLTQYPPFNYDGSASSDTKGYDYGGISANATVATPYTIEVQRTERNTGSNYATAITYCKSLGSDWRIPTKIEQFTIYQNKATLEAMKGFAAFSNVGAYYWSSSVYNANATTRCSLRFTDGYHNGGGTGNSWYVRCIREVTPLETPAIVTIDQDLANTYKTWIESKTAYPLFDYDGTDRGGTSSTWKVTKEYSIEVEKTQRYSIANYSTTQSYCSGLGTGWRIPTHIELKAMYDNKTALENTGCTTFNSDWYWSSSVHNANANNRCELRFSDGAYGFNGTGYSYFVRCVRDI